MTEGTSTAPHRDVAPIIIPFRELDLDQIAAAGGKNANLGVLLKHLAPSGIRIPDGFAVAADAFRRHLREARLDTDVYTALDALDIRDVDALAKTAHSIRERIHAAPLPDQIAGAVIEAYEVLSREAGEVDAAVAVRSSATAEDLPELSFAGQHDSFGNVRGSSAVLDAVRACMASLFTDRAIVYRHENGIAHRDVALSVGIQRMVRSDLACAGVMFTLDTETGFRDVVEIDAAWGLGESVVKGRVNPDAVVVHKPTLARGFRPIVRRDIGDKATKLVYDDRGAIAEVEVEAAARRRPVLSDDEALELARWAMAIEAYHARRLGREAPMDIEWAKDGRTNELYVVQARPETVHSRRGKPTLELYRLTGHGETVATGTSIGTKIAAGRARVIRDANELSTFRAGEVLVTEMTDPDWEPVLSRAAAIVTDRGGRTCHAAIVARELGIPCVVGTETATRTIATDDELTVSCAEGEVGRVYRGRIPYESETLDPSTLPRPAVPVMLNVGDPGKAFSLGQLPSAGVGLARIEFIVSSIGIHPMALVHPDRIRDPQQRDELVERTKDLVSPSELFVDRLATGVAQIAAAFYPRPVIVRFSDFKTNEYAGLLGGKDFEPDEANPMLGFRGASRYYDDRYREGFALECEAIRRVRHTMGLTNVKVMIPFCRTLEEARRVLDVMVAADLRRGQDGLEVYVMCEIPNNVILAARFAELFDGFSIGSNDLTQLALGVDRDSELLAHVFDENDPGVRALIAQVVETAHRHGCPVGFCGQAPSDQPEYAGFLASLGIDSVSVTPDALPAVIRHLATHQRGAITRAAGALRRRLRHAFAARTS